MDTPIDKLVFALGGDVGPINDAFKKVEQGAAKTGEAVQKHLGKGFDEAAKAAGASGASVGGAFGQVEQHAKKISEHIQVSRREMVYFFRELANGDIQRLPATMALFLSHLLEISPAAIAAAGAVAAIPLAVAVSAVKADEALAKLRTSLALTANASGISLSQATAAAQQSAAASNGVISQMGAQRIMGGLIGSGMPRSLLGTATTAAGNYALGAGVSQENAQNVIARMWQNPARAAEEMQRSMHLLTVEQEQQVKDLSESGQQEKAAAIILGEFKDRAREAAEAAGFWSKALNNMGNMFGNLGHWFGTGFGAGSPKEKLAHLQNSDMGHLVALGFHNPGYDAEVKSLQDEIKRSAEDARIKGNHATANDAVGGGLADANKEAASFQARLESLQNELNRDTYAVNQANTAHAAFSVQTLQRINDQKRAAETALSATRQYGAPGMEEARRAADARELARTPLNQMAVVQARQRARETRIQELQNPSTALFAEGNYRLNMQSANLANATQLKEQDRRLQGMRGESEAAKKIANAYDISTAAVQRATVEAKVDAMITSDQINKKDRLKAINYELAQSIAEVRQQLAKQVQAASIETEATRMELAAGGNPLALMRATAAATAFRSTEADMRRAEGNPAAQAEIARRRSQLTDSDFQRAQMEAQKQAQSGLFGAQTNLNSQRLLNAGRTSGLTEDELRRYEVWVKTTEAFVRNGLDPSLAVNQKLFQQTLQTNVALSDLSDQMEKTAQEAKGLADGLTSGLRDMAFGNNPAKDWKVQMADMGRNLMGTVADANVFEPMNKWLTGQFSNIIGGQKGPMALGASVANPMWVRNVSAMGVPGSGSGGLMDLLGSGGGGSGMFSMGNTGLMDSLFSGGGAAAGGGGGIMDLLSSALMFLPMMATGGYKGPNDYVIVGEQGPEILGPGVAGVVTPLTAPTVTASLGTNAGGRGGSNTNFGDMHFHLPNVQDAQGFIRSKSQLSSAITRATGAGRRNN